MAKKTAWLSALAGLVLAASVSGGVALSEAGAPSVAAVLTRSPLEHLSGLVVDPASAARLNGNTFLAPLAGGYALPADRAGFLNRHTLAGVHTIRSLLAAASADPGKRVVLGGTIVSLSDVVPSRLVVVDGQGNTAKVLFEKPASGGWVLVIDRPLGALLKAAPTVKGGGAYITLP